MKAPAPGTVSLLHEQEGAIVDEATAAVLHAHLTHYQHAGQLVTRQRLATLFELVVASLATRDLTGVVVYAEEVAHERFHAGVGIVEVLTAFNALEEAMWRRIVADQPASGLAESLGLLSTAFGTAKDALASTYVSLASSAHVPSLDLSALFSGSTA